MKTPNRVFHDSISYDQAIITGYFKCPFCKTTMNIRQGDYCPKCNQQVSKTYK